MARARVQRIQLLDGILQTLNGVLVPHDGVPPDRVVGTTVDKARAVLDLGRAPIDRCLAAAMIAPAVLDDLLSTTYAANLRRVARKVHPGLVQACRDLAVPMRELQELASFEEVDEQRRFLREREELALERVGRPRGRAGGQRRMGPRAVGARDRRTLRRLIDKIGPRALKKLIDSD